MFAPHVGLERTPTLGKETPGGFAPQVGLENMIVNLKRDISEYEAYQFI